MTLETVALLTFFSVNLKVIILGFQILPSHVSPVPTNNSWLHMARCKFLYCIVLYCI